MTTSFRARMTEHATVLFDGVCNLCNASVRTIAANDPDGYFRFASLDSDAARVSLAPFGRTPESFESIVVIDAAGLFERSDAALRVACYLRFPWPLAAVLYAVPKKIRDDIYAWIAANRYRVFGKTDRCPIPPPQIAERFL